MKTVFGYFHTNLMISLKAVVTIACFMFVRARAPRQFLLGKGHPKRKLLISIEIFHQGHQGMVFPGCIDAMGDFPPQGGSRPTG